MPRKAKIVAVPIDAPVAEPVEETPPEVKTDAEEMTTVINELKTDDQPVAQEVAEPSVVELSVVEPTAKPKRAPRAKKVKEQEQVQAEVVAVEPTLEETADEVTVPEEKQAPAVVKEKVACPDCGKQMSAKTLKYSHAPNCTVKQINVKEEMLESLLEQRLSSVKQERLARKQAMVEKLISGAF